MPAGTPRLSRLRYPGIPFPATLSDFSGGLNTRDSAAELARNESGDLGNVTFDERGGVGARLGFVKYNAAAAYSALILASAPLVYYRLNEPSGTAITDSSGNGRSGTLQGGGFTLAQAGALAGDTDTAIRWPGGSSSDLAEASGGYALTAGTYYVSLWFKRTTPGRRDPLWWMGNFASGAGVYLYVDTDDKLKFALGSAAAGAGVSVVATASVTCADTAWHHAFFSANGGRLYLDGVLVAVAGGATAGVAASLALFGSAGFGSAIVATLDGTLDEPAIFGASLTAAQADTAALSHYRAGAIGGGSYSTTAKVLNGFAWDTAGHKIVQCGASVFLDTATVAFKTFTTDARVDFADFLGKLYIIHPVDGLFVSDGTTGGTSRVLGGPKGSTLTPWQNELWAAGDPDQKPRVYFTVPGNGGQWTDSMTLINGTPTLPTATITVDSTSGFDPTGAITIGEGGTAQTVSYTGVTATTFTGCTGGTGAVADNTIVTQGPRFVDIREKDDNTVVCLSGASGEDISGRPGLLAFKRRSAYRIYDSATGSYLTIDPAVGAAGSMAAVSALGRTYTISEAGIFWTDGTSAMRNEGDKLRPLWAAEQLAFDQTDLWAAGAKGNRLFFSVPLVGQTRNGLALEHFPAASAEQAATVTGSNAVSCYFTSHTGEERLFGGSPSVSGQVYELGRGGTDDGAPIHSWFQTPWYPLVPSFKARLRRLVVEGRGDAINLYVKRDFTTDQGTLIPISISLSSALWDDGSKWDDGTLWGPETLVGFSPAVPSLGVAAVFAFRFDATTVVATDGAPLVAGGAPPQVGAWAVQGIHLQAIPTSAV